jgi:hypothetical protein
MGAIAVFDPTRENVPYLLHLFLGIINKPNTLGIASPKTSGNCAERGDSVDSKLQRQNGEYGGGTAISISANNPLASKNRTSPSGKKARSPAPLSSLLFFQIELKHIR